VDQRSDTHQERTG